MLIFVSTLYKANSVCPVNAKHFTGATLHKLLRLSRKFENDKLNQESY